MSHGSFITHPRLDAKFGVHLIKPDAIDDRGQFY